jgi:hypothetical protein
VPFWKVAALEAMLIGSTATVFSLAAVETAVAPMKVRIRTRKK